MSSIANNLYRNMMVLSRSRTKRVSSWDKTGGNRDFLTLEPGETRILADIEGPAIINNFYVTMALSDLLHYRKAVIRMYWDHEKSPSVEVPIGDFFGIPFGQPQFFQSLMLSVTPGADRSSTEGLNMYFPMPFGRHARIELFNDSKMTLWSFWYHINYEEVSKIEPDVGYFHSCWNRENPCERIVYDNSPAEDPNIHCGVNLTGDDNYVILDAKGCGNYVGCILQIDNPIDGWYGEGDDMIFIDGDTWPPSLHGTGTEEIFGGGACPNEAYFTPYCGYLQVQDPKFKGRNAMYKFFVNDPVRFNESIRVTLEHGHANNLGNDYTSVAYWYQSEPHAQFAPLPPVADRMPRLPESCIEALRLHKEASELSVGFFKKRRLPAEERERFSELWNECKAAFANHDFETFALKVPALRDMAEALNLDFPYR
ncbi:glycoside hydrolase family 172 protein [Candidatus Hydrogenedentota bacterium]